MKIASASFSFILSIHTRAMAPAGITCWSWASEQPLGQWLLSSLVSASCSTSEAAVLCSALSFPLKGRGAGGAASAVPGLGALRMCSQSQECPAQLGASVPGRISACPELQPHTAGTAASPPVLQREALSIYFYRNKSKARNLFTTENIREYL